MPIIKSRFVWTTAAILLAGTVAQAATLTGVQGAVLVNKGQGYHKVTGSMQLTAGDSVMIEPGASAQITYDDGCQVPMQAGAVVVIGAQSPCTLGSQWTNWFTLETLEIGGLVVAGAGAAAWALAGNPASSNPASSNPASSNPASLDPASP